MKRFLYTLLTVALSTGAPATATVEDLNVDAGDEISDISSASPDRRGRIAGSFLVERTGGGLTDVRSLEAPETPWRDAVTARLLEAVLDRCTGDGTLKLRLDVPLPQDRLTSLCRRSRFNYWRTVMRRGHPVHEYYADLYTLPPEVRRPARI